MASFSVAPYGAHMCGRPYEYVEVQIVPCMYHVLCWAPPASST